MESELVKYTGGCHCKAIRFELLAPKNLSVWKCNCTICYMKQNHNFIIPKTNFKLIADDTNITTYTFNKHIAQHKFCKICGVQAFYFPRSNQDGVAITIYCLDPETMPNEIKYQEFDGINWENSIENVDIKKYSN